MVNGWTILFSWNTYFYNLWLRKINDLFFWTGNKESILILGFAFVAGNGMNYELFQSVCHNGILSIAWFRFSFHSHTIPPYIQSQNCMKGMNGIRMGKRRMRIKWKWRWGVTWQSLLHSTGRWALKFFLIIYGYWNE